MLGREERAFGLDYSFHASFFQEKADCAGREGFIDDVGESFGHLDYILCLLRDDKMDGILNIGRGKFGWMTTRGLLKLRMLFGAKPSDGRDIDTSGRGNRVS